MNRTRVARAAGAAVLAALTVVPGTALASASEPSAALPAGVLAAYQRDLGLDSGQVKARLELERTAAATQKSAREFAGAAYGGAWYDQDSGQLVVGVTDEAKSRVVKALGAEPKVVAHSATTLTDTKDKIDRAGKAPGAVTGWYVDTRANSVVVTVKRGVVDGEVSKFLDAAKAAGPVSVVETDSAPRLYADIVGGDAYNINNQSRCSIGFAVSGGFVSAGHCGSSGDSVTSGGQAMGSFEGSSFPGNDYSYVTTGSGWTPW